MQSTTLSDLPANSSVQNQLGKREPKSDTGELWLAFRNFDYAQKRILVQKLYLLTSTAGTQYFPIRLSSGRSRQRRGLNAFTL